MLSAGTVQASGHRGAPWSTRPKLVWPTSRPKSGFGHQAQIPSTLMKELNQSEKTTFIFFHSTTLRVWAYCQPFVVRLADGQIRIRVIGRRRRFARVDCPREGRPDARVFSTTLK